MVELKAYTNEQEQMLELIRQFWIAHNHEVLTREALLCDLEEWTKEGHRLYLILWESERSGEKETVGFLHLGSRGCEADWLEDIFVLEKYQGRGIGSQAVKQVEEIVKQYSDSLYIEAAARNERAIQLYRKLGYDCLNTITVRKDFREEDYETIREENIYGQKFGIKKRKE